MAKIVAQLNLRVIGTLIAKYIYKTSIDFGEKI